MLKTLKSELGTEGLGNNHLEWEVGAGKNIWLGSLCSTKCLIEGELSVLLPGTSAFVHMFALQCWLLLKLG